MNDELGELTQGLAAAERVLQPGGRLAVVTFHSLEDAIVKRFLKLRSGRQEQGSRHLPPLSDKMGAPPERQPSFRFVNPRPINPSETETATNPRARSARLRWAARTDAPAWPAEAAPAVPRLGSV